MRLFGEPVSDEDVKTLVDLLHRLGRADDLNLAARPDLAIGLGTKILALSPAESDALLGVLDAHPTHSSSSAKCSLATIETVSAARRPSARTRRSCS